MSKKKVDNQYAITFKLDMEPVLHEKNIKEIFPKTYKKMIPYFKQYCEENLEKVEIVHRDTKGKIIKRFPNSFEGGTYWITDVFPTEIETDIYEKFDKDMKKIIQRFADEKIKEKTTTKSGGLVNE